MPLVFIFAFFLEKARCNMLKSKHCCQILHFFTTIKNLILDGVIFFSEQILEVQMSLSIMMIHIRNVSTAYSSALGRPVALKFSDALILLQRWGTDSVHHRSGRTKNFPVDTSLDFISYF